MFVQRFLVANEEARLERGDEVPMVPRLKATLGLRYNFTDKLAGFVNYTYLAKQHHLYLDLHFL